MNFASQCKSTLWQGFFTHDLAATFIMRSFPFRKTTQKGLAEIQTSTGSHESQPDSSGSHVNDQHSVIDSPSTPAERGVTTANSEKSAEAQIHQNDHPEYPHGLKLTTITIAVALPVFLVALVRSPSTPFSPSTGNRQ